MKRISENFIEKILKLLHIDIQQKEKMIIKNEQYITNELIENGYKIEFINIQNNSINGCVFDNIKKFFFKILPRDRGINEIIGYINLYNNMPISNLRKVLKYKNVYIIFFNYDKSIEKNEGLLNDLLVKADYENYSEKYDKTIGTIIEIYTSNLNKKITSKLYPMQLFFNGRVDERLNKWYNNFEIFDYKIKIDNKNYINITEIIKETTRYFKNENIYDCYLTQGDPNVLNIGTKPIFFDYETAGYNSIIAEVSTFICSILFVDLYFAPKYHRNSYKNHEAILDKSINIDIDYKIDNDKNQIDIKYIKSSTAYRKKLILKYLEELEKMQINMSSDIKYFFVMRILCIFNLCNMEEKEVIYSITLLEKIYNAFETYKTDAKEDLKKIIVEIVK